MLRRITNEGFPEKIEDVEKECQKFFVYRNDLSELEEVVLWKGKVVIPEALMGEVLPNLHIAHQGCSRMQARAKLCVFWPSMSRDIERKQALRQVCEENAPSQKSQPFRTVLSKKSAWTISTSKGGTILYQ